MEWISVKEKRPEVGERVLGFSDLSGCQMVYMANFGIWKYTRDSDVMFGTITHWMSLPEPPKD